jgi:hypothetical protein
MATDGFDCIEMKQRVQEEIRHKYAGVPEKEALRMQREAALADPILGPFLRKVGSRQRGLHRVGPEGN